MTEGFDNIQQHHFFQREYRQAGLQADTMYCKLGFILVAVGQLVLKKKKSDTL